MFLFAPKLLTDWIWVFQALHCAIAPQAFTVALVDEFADKHAHGEQQVLMMQELRAVYSIIGKHEVTCDELMAWRAHAAFFAFHYIPPKEHKCTVLGETFDFSFDSARFN